MVLGGQNLPDEVDQVVPGAGSELRRVARRQLQVGDAADPHLDPVGVTPLLGELVEPCVVGRNEVAPHQDPEARPLDLRRCLSRLEHREQRRAGCSPAGDAQEATAAESSVIGQGGWELTHHGPPL